MDQPPHDRTPDCVGALILDDRHRVFVHRCSATHRVLPGVWDIVGGHIQPGEAEHAALAREIYEETGWRLLRVRAQIADWRWRYAGVQRRERDYLVEVEGDLQAPARAGPARRLGLGGAGGS